MKYLINTSGGSGSIVAGARCIERYGKDAVHWVFADTNSEHPSLYHLLDETERVLGVTIVRLNDGRNVWDVFNKERLMKTPNGGCKAAIELKHKQLDSYRDKHFDPADTTLVLGMDWMEPERMERARARMPGWQIEFPLTWPKRLSKAEEVCELGRLGLPTPDLYLRGHRHNNCAGACVLAGTSQWAGLLEDDPERFMRYAAQEAAWREAIGQDYSICKDRRGGTTKSMTLLALKERVEAGEKFREWRSTCNCMGVA